MLFAGIGCGINTTINKTPQNFSDDDIAQLIEKADKKYAQCIFTDLYKYDTLKIFEFTGKDIEATNVKKEVITISQATTKWEKGKPDPNCTASPPDTACMVMMLVDVPAVKKTYYVVTDTLKNKAFKTTEVPFKTLFSVGGRSGWVEVLCEKNINGAIISKVNQQLIDLGYLSENLIVDKQKVGQETKDAIRKYQEYYGIPIGGTLNIPTLEHLGLYISSKD